MTWQPEPETTPEPIRLETHEDAVNLVKQIFQEMGGRVMPPRRPGHLHEHDTITRDRDDFMMDFEYCCLSEHWNSSIQPHPKGSKRYEDPEWAARIQAQVYPNHSEVDWYEYCDWVSKGFGDVWFQEEMGGRVIPPARPGKTKPLYMDVRRYSFLMDFENSCLTEHWGVKPHPRGNKRYEDPEWAAMIQSQVYPNHSDVDWYEYVEWVSQGGGDDWFEEEGVDV